MILALEFSTNRRSVAVFETSEESMIPPQLLAAGDEEVQRGTSPFVLLERVLEKAQVNPSQLVQILVGIGPGSYTGIRSALAIARGWQLAQPVLLQGIATSDILAKQTQASGFTGRLHTVIDAQRDEIYATSYLISTTDIQSLGPTTLKNPTLLLIEEGDLVLGPGADRWFPEARSIFPEACLMAILARQSPHLLKDHAIEPIYLRETTFQKAPPPRRLPADIS